MKDRYYQTEAHEATISHILTQKTNPMLFMAGGSGKSIQIAKAVKHFVEEWRANVIVLTHRKELIKQDYKSLCKVWPEGRRFAGINSASLNCRDYNKKIIFAGINSVYKDAKLFPNINCLLIDEVHRVQIGLDSGIYQQFIADLRKINPKMRIIGYSAQDWREDAGKIAGFTRHHAVNEVIYSIGNAELVAKKYLSPLINKASLLKARPDVSNVPLTEKGEFIEKYLEDAVISQKLVEAQVDEIESNIGNRKTALVFCVTIKHSDLVFDELNKRGHKAVNVNHKTTPEDRDAYFKAFDSGEVSFLINVAIATEGYDNPNIDFIADLAPVWSLGRYMQKYCRGSRVKNAICACGEESFDLLPCSKCGKEVSRFKKDCFILDCAGNINRHGSIDEIEINFQTIPKKSREFKYCPKCKELVAKHLRKCPFCNLIFEDQDIERRSSAKDKSTIPVLSEPVWMNIIKIQVSKSTKNPRTHIVANIYCENGVKLFQNIQLHKPKFEENWVTRIDHKISSGTEYCRLKLDRYTTKPTRVQVISEKGNMKIIGVE